VFHALNDKSMNLTKQELDVIIYCMEQMYSAFDDDEPDYQSWLTAIEKLDNELSHFPN